MTGWTIENHKLGSRFKSKFVFIRLFSFYSFFNELVANKRTELEHSQVEKRLQVCGDAERRYLNMAFESACKLAAFQYLGDMSKPSISQFFHGPELEKRKEEQISEEDPAETYLVLDQNGSEA